MEDAAEVGGGFKAKLAADILDGEGEGGGENGELAKQILDEYMQGFIKRNHTLHVFSAHLHMDEAL